MIHKSSSFQGEKMACSAKVEYESQLQLEHSYFTKRNYLNLDLNFYFSSPSAFKYPQIFGRKTFNS